MSLFICDECGSVDNTALTRYALRNIPEFGLGGRALCSACDPETGRWHGKFERHQWDGEQLVLNPTNERGK